MANTISLRRRRLMIAGVAGAAVPATGLTALRADGAPEGIVGTVSIGRGETLLVSGRIVDAESKPVAGARVDLLHDAREHVAAVTDGDGRFMLTATAPRELRDVEYRVTRDGFPAQVSRMHFVRTPRAGRAELAALQRDESGVWRTTVGLTYA
jgi:hypothetical protein